MANVFAISLVLTTLIIAGLVSPNDGNIKVSISQQETEQKANTGDVSDVKDTSSEDEVKENGGFHRVNARELVCDAFGKCKHRIASALEGTKETVSGKAHDAAEKMHEIGENTKKAFGEVKDTVAGKAHEASEKAKESVGKIGNAVKEDAKRKAKDVADISDTLRGDVKRNASEDLAIVEDAVKEDAHRLKVEGKRVYHQEIQRFFSHVSAYVFSSNNFRWFMGMIHLLGFASSYGVLIWVTYKSSTILANALPKQQFAAVQSKIYPAYYRTQSYGVATAFLGHYFSQSHPYYANRTETIQGLIFLAIFSLTMFSSLYLEPRATKAMGERIKLEKEEGEGEKDVFNAEPSTTNVNTIIEPTGTTVGKTTTTRETLETQQELSERAERVKPQVERLSRRIKKLNLISSSLNALTLMGLTYHLVYLSQLVHSSNRQL